jgi:hypothetical protein
MSAVIAREGEAIQNTIGIVWIASSLALPCANTLGLSQAMTGLMTTDLRE